MSEIEELYARIPEVKGCRTGCSDCCGPVPMAKAEERAIPSPMRPEPLSDVFITPTKACGTCSYSTAAGCSVYSSRPFMCRLFGASVEEPRLRCPHGARPDRPLTAAQANELSGEYVKLMGATS